MCVEGLCQTWASEKAALEKPMISEGPLQSVLGSSQIVHPERVASPPLILTQPEGLILRVLLGQLLEHRGTVEILSMLATGVAPAAKPHPNTSVEVPS